MFLHVVHLFSCSQALKNGESLKLPFSHHGIKILTSGINLILEIPHLKAVITFGLTGFSVTLPFQFFGGNTQGHCGKNILLSLLVAMLVHQQFHVILCHYGITSL